MEDGDIQIISKFAVQCADQQKEIERLKQRISSLKRIEDELADDRDTWRWIAHHQRTFLREKGLFMNYFEWDDNKYKEAEATNNTRFLNRHENAMLQTWGHPTFY